MLHVSLEALLEDAQDAGKVVERVNFHVGVVNAGSWRRLLRLYGDTVVRIGDEDEEIYWRTTLRAWYEQALTPCRRSLSHTWWTTQPPLH